VILFAVVAALIVPGATLSARLVIGAAVIFWFGGLNVLISEVRLRAYFRRHLCSTDNAATSA
jgi:hypothetical protein